MEKVILLLAVIDVDGIWWDRMHDKFRENLTVALEECERKGDTFKRKLNQVWQMTFSISEV